MVTYSRIVGPCNSVKHSNIACVQPRVSTSVLWFRIKPAFLSMFQRASRPLAAMLSANLPDEIKRDLRSGEPRKIRKFRRHIQCCFTIPFVLVLMGLAQATSLKADALFSQIPSEVATVHHRTGATSGQFPTVSVQSETKKTA